MNIKKPLLIAGVASAVSIAGLGTGGMAMAASNTSNTGGESNLVDKIASTFNLDKSKVQSLFDQDRQEREAERDQQVAADLTQLVKDGKLTEAQKSAITAKRAELKQQMESERSSDTNKDKSSTDRKAEMKTKRTELETWAKQQGIDAPYLRYVMPGGGHGGPGMRGDKPADAPADSPSTSTTQS